MERHYGKYRARVLNNVDPMAKGRIQVDVPEVSGPLPSSWAKPCVPLAGLQTGLYAPPPVNSGVWVEFEQGEIDRPIWVGCFWGHAGEVPALAHTFPPGTSGIAMQTVLQGKFDQDEIEIYKGRPLEGIWATAPYLHNGSVPTLAELMKLPKDRNIDSETKKKSFCVGSRQFLPKEVGFKYVCNNYSAEEKLSRFVFDTTIPGNSDSGHAYPDPSVIELKPEERDALVIYQKSL